jgi:hypothetical protein
MKDSMGCNGCYPEKVMDYFKTTPAMTAADYPLDPKHAVKPCKYDATKATKCGIKSYEHVNNTQDDIKAHLAVHPLTAALNGHSYEF